MTRLGDEFGKDLEKAGEDFNKFYAFSEFVESIGKDGVPDIEKLPVGLAKMRPLGIRHAIIEFDLVYKGIDYTKFTVNDICALAKKRMEWCRSEKDYTKIPKFFSTFVISPTPCDWSRSASSKL